MRNYAVNKIKDDFDQIALISDEGWNHNNHYHNFILKQIPSSCINTLDIGCGKGSFARLLAERSEQVLALDISTNMINIAKEQSKAYDNIDFEVADALAWDFPDDQFDFIASIATLHHLPLDVMLAKMKKTLRNNGVLVVLDLFEDRNFKGILTSAIAMPINVCLNLIMNGPLRESQEIRKIWDEHFENDVLLPLSHIRKICDSVLPGAKIRRHLFWRYSIVWRKPNH
jgi:ubiquinone/menaquinone biosynthesis C-methylase UbiE